MLPKTRLVVFGNYQNRGSSFLVIVPEAGVRYNMGMKRIYENLLVDHLRNNRQMLFVSGPRQVGKTTLAKLVLPEGRYFNYDRTSDALLFAKGPDGLAETLAFDQPAVRATAVFQERREFHPQDAEDISVGLESSV